MRMIKNNISVHGITETDRTPTATGECLKRNAHKFISNLSAGTISERKRMESVWVGGDFLTPRCDGGRG